MSNKQIEIYAQALKRQREEQKVKPQMGQEVSSGAEGRSHGEKIQNEDNPQNATQKVTQAPTQISNFLSKSLRTEDIEQLNFELRKVSKVRVNADVPHEWKKLIDDLAHELGVGKYELLMYVIGLYLGKVKRKKPA